MNTSDKELIESLRMIEDIVWLFNIQKNDFKARMPGYFGPFIFNEKKLLQGKRITAVSRLSYGSQTHKDERSISNIYAIDSQDRHAFEHIADFSYNSLMQLVEDKELFEKCEENVNEFEVVKVGI